MDAKEQQEKISQLRILLIQNQEDAHQARGYRSNVVRNTTLTSLRVEREQLEHQLLLLTGFQEAEVARIIGDLKLEPAGNSKKKDEGDDKEPVRV
jgi:hypothetical protein